MSNTDKYRTRLINLLKELFQLDQPELDFGFYKIMHAKSVQITRFLEDDLLKVIQEAFGEVDENRVADAKAQYEAAIEQAKKFGAPNPEDTDGVKEAKAQYEQVKDGGNAESEIYDHLYRFFERYYDNGDFMSRRYYARESDSRAAPYAVPYDGREVYLHWANKDQYYIKSSEYLSNYTFDLNEAIRQEAQKAKGAGLEQFASHDEQPLKVHFRIADASEGEHGNIKAAGDQKRFFLIHAAKPVELQSRVDKRSASTDIGALMVDAPKGLSTLHINFEYRTDPDKTGQDAKWQETRLKEAEAKIIAALQSLDVAEFLKGLTTPAPTDSKDKRTLLGKYLQKYAARNTMDYFIHKDLGGFLRRELDFYIKNEIMRLDDIENADVPQVQNYLAIIRVLRTIARQLIDFLAQLEEFQKKLWLKKKFVTESHYCITLDRIDAKFYPEIAANDRQREEWVKLFAIDEIAGDLATPVYSEPLTVEFLAANPFLLIDTALFSDDFKQRLLAEIPDLDMQCDGVLIHSENFQALGLIQEKYREQVKCIYIDPPYNTGGNDFKYKDNYQHSSWLSMVIDRLKFIDYFSSDDAVFFASIDDNEVVRFRYLIESIFGPSAFQSQIIIQSNKRGQTFQSIAKTHEYLLSYSIGKNAEIFELQKEVPGNALRDENGPYELWELRNRNPKFGKHNRPNLYYPIYVAVSECNQDGYAKISLEKSDKFCFEVFPINSSNMDSCWRWGQDKVKTSLSVETLDILVAKQKRDGGWNIYEKSRKSSTKAKSIWTETDVINEQGTVEVGSLGISDFGFPKPTGLIKKVLQIGANENCTVLDYFAGSGTTAHAVLGLNREDQGTRKYILVEQSYYFDSVLKPRIQKVVYSKDWKDGKPVSREGISHCFKYLRLESYEDALNNLIFREDAARDQALANNPDLRRDYLLNYFLDVETQGSRSLLNIADFRDPTAYRLWVKKPGSEEQTRQSIDLIETFNWLLGLWVQHSAAPQVFSAEFTRETDPDLPQDQNTRLRCMRLKPAAFNAAGSGGCATLIHPTGDDNGRVDKRERIHQEEPQHYWFRLIEGYTLKIPGDNSSKIPTLIVWRKLTNDPEKDNAVLQTYLLEKLQISPREQTYGAIYVNGSHTLPNPVIEGEQIKVRLIEEAFHAAMWSEE